VKTAVSAATLALVAALLAGCSAPAPVEIVHLDEPTPTATPVPVGTVASVQAASWDPAQHPDRVKRQDFIARVSTANRLRSSLRAEPRSPTGIRRGQFSRLRLGLGSIPTTEIPAMKLFDLHYPTDGARTCWRS
jgi:hypothetical protein